MSLITEASDNSYLSLGSLIGSGKERNCYQHPFNPRLCIKVTKTGITGRQQNKLDWTYYGYLQKQGISSPHVPKCHYWVNTNEGQGLVVDRICKADLSPAPTLLEALQYGELNLDEVTRLVDIGFINLMKMNIVVVDYHPDIGRTLIKGEKEIDLLSFKCEFGSL